MRLVFVLLLGSLFGLGGSSRLDLAHASRHAFGLEDALAFTAFPLFDAGERVDGLSLTAVLRRNDSADFVSFVYGDCQAGDDAGCAPPAEVQVWPACRRNLHLYESSRPGTPRAERTTVRGVPVAFLDDGVRLELQASRSTIVVFGDSPARVLRVAAALRAVGKSSSSGPLPAPDPGAVAGQLRC
jgi:hypothetical protein